MTGSLSRRAVLGGVAGGAALFAAGAGSAAAAGPVREPYVPLTVGGGGGPVGTDRVHVLKVGPDTARTVLVMVPGMFGAANDFRWAARDLVAAVPGVQVWAFDRREENLADRSGFRTADPVAYYLDGHYRTQDPAASAFAAGWGLTRTLEDLRAVVRTAARGGRRVVLGGHSWGATTAMAYAAWDFDGCPGYRDVAALVLVDGGVRGAFDGTGEPVADSPEQVKERLAAIEGGAVFDMTLSAVGLGDRAESTQIWYQLAGWYAHRDPDGPSVLQPRMPDALRPPVPVTNAALLGTLVDAGIGWPNDISVHSGHLADSGEPRGWVDTGITPIGRVATAYAGGPEPAVWEWYWPARLSVDLDVTDPYADTDTARSLGLRLKHAAGLDVPLYAFQTSYAQGTIVSAAREVVADSRIPYATYETDNGMNHLDPLFAAPQHNTFTRSLAPFLAGLLP
ncbi:alpha/beta hydrolase [Streptomyces sp. SAI-127]|uniref:alpha/beta hydrolase n=1 Tax=Streptomyces sp. SAI-127 TaxID=2940543 RepID=UPI0024757BF0|nr:alpha/beta hydrolase [Streptomyces sp. SAI-127]MDH6485751.1 pimeloyl-ACP methyl ester carboxylesterase [Streptomyces sp. SAI-127]